MLDERIKPIGNKKVKQKVKDFCKFVDENKAKKFYICSHDNPDPDSIGSSFGMSRILHFLGVQETGIYYCGEVSHPQNRAMQNILNIPLTKWNIEIEKEATDGIIVFVDCANKQKNMSIDLFAHIAIDHHKIAAHKDTLFIHDDIGACSSLVTELMLSLISCPDSPEIESDYCFNPEECKDIITALAVGIKTDTRDFIAETVSGDDFKSYKLLSQFINEDKFTRIINYELPSYMFDYEEIAWKNKNLEAPNLISGLGFINESHSDCVPYLADKMMRIKGIQTVVIYAVAGKEVRASVRTVDATIDVNDMCEEMFGCGNGGGKHGSAGARVGFNVFDVASMPNSEKEALWNLIQSTYESKFEQAIKK